MYQVIDCPSCSGPPQDCGMCRGRRRVLCFPYVKAAVGEELRLFRVRYLGSVDPIPMVTFLDVAAHPATNGGNE